MKKKCFYDRPVEMRYITRLDNEHQHGWRVRIGQTAEQYVAKFFSDFKYKDSLKAAKIFRTRIAYTLFHNKNLRMMRKNKNTSGFVSGTVRLRCCKRNGLVHKSVLVVWHPKPGVEKTKIFSIKKYGNDEAWRLARLFLNRGLKLTKNQK